MRVECETEKDCPQSPNAFYVIKCVDHFCEWVQIDIDFIPWLLDLGEYRNILQGRMGCASKINGT